MFTHHALLREELLELTEKISKLYDFRANSVATELLGVCDRALVERQLDLMKDYAAVLVVRLALSGNSSKEDSCCS